MPDESDAEKSVIVTRLRASCCPWLYEIAVWALPCPSRVSPLIVTTASVGAFTISSVPVDLARPASIPAGTLTVTAFETVAPCPSTPDSSTVTVPCACTWFNARCNVKQGAARLQSLASLPVTGATNVLNTVEAPADPAESALTTPTTSTTTSTRNRAISPLLPIRQNPCADSNPPAHKSPVAEMGDL